MGSAKLARRALTSGEWFHTFLPVMRGTPRPRALPPSSCPEPHRYTLQLGSAARLAPETASSSVALRAGQGLRRGARHAAWSAKGKLGRCDGGARSARGAARRALGAGAVRCAGGCRLGWESERRRSAHRRRPNGQRRLRCGTIARPRARRAPTSSSSREANGSTASKRRIAGGRPVNLLDARGSNCAISPGRVGRWSGRLHEPSR
jgi:hypothetical protein